MKKQLMAVVALLSMMLPLFPTAAAAAESGRADSRSVYAGLQSGDLTQEKLSKQEIRALLAANPNTMPSEPSDIFVTVPNVTSPHAPGQVKNEILQRTVNRLNALRKIAGLPATQLDDALCQNAQYGAVLLTYQFSHKPSKPSDMTDDFYQKGYAATSSSNIFAGRALTATPDDFMDDSDQGNVDRLGHRRWQLNPTLGKIGFGYAVCSTGYKRYTAEKVFDNSGSGCDYQFIGWPASGAFPSDLFGSNIAWSVTVNPKKYQTPVMKNITVKLTRESDKQTWTFPGTESYTAAGTGRYFNVETSGYGVSNCIIFRPELEQSSVYSGLYTVEITGLKDTKGNAAAFSYQVDFFSLEDDDSTVKVNGSNVIYTPNSDSPKNGVLVVASYASNGKMLDAETRSNMGKAETFQLNLSSGGFVTAYFLQDLDSCKPLCESITALTA